MKSLAILLPLGLAACAGQQDITAQPVTIQPDSFCEVQRTKIKWSIDDTRPTIDQIRRFNAKHDALCGDFVRTAQK